MIGDLEQYVSEANDPKLTKWWARYCESVGEYEKALLGYQAANDYLSLVRVYCAQGDFQVAVEIVEESNDPARTRPAPTGTRIPPRRPSSLFLHGRTPRMIHFTHFLT